MATYYVAKTGNNANNGTSIALAKLTIKAGIALLSAGDTLFVRAGTYDEGKISSCPSGTSWSNMVRIANYQGETVWLSPTSGDRAIAFAAFEEYIEIDGINIDARGNTTGWPVILECYGSGPGFDQLPALGNAHHIRIKNAELIMGSNGTTGATPTSDGPIGILVTQIVDTPTGGNEFSNLTIHGGGDVGDFAYSFYINSGGNLIENCNLYDNSGYGIHIYSYYAADAIGNIVRNNVIHDISRSPDTRIAGIILGSGSGNQVYNNVVYNCGGSVGAGIQVYTSNTNEIYNNTVYNCSGGGIWVQTGVTGTILRNNIAYNNGGLGNYYDQGTSTNLGTSNLFGVDPLFVNAAAHDFRLQPNSPAVNTGTTLSLVTTDIVGTPRPAGAYDKGAYEYTTGGGGSVVPVVPGAFGFGMSTRAAYGGSVNPTVIRVTSLSDTGAGTLREALTTAGPRVVIFETSGTIDLGSDIVVLEPYLTIAGQTAPSPGITLKGFGIQIYTHDVLVQHLRIRPGDGPPLQPQSFGHDGAIAYDGNGVGVYGVVYDHVSISWAQGFNGALISASSGAEIAWWKSFITEGLYHGQNVVVDAGQSSSLGLLVSQALAHVPASVSIIGNLFAHNSDYNPEIGGPTSVHFINNVVYDWGKDATSYPWATFINGDSGDGGQQVDVIGNKYIAGPVTGSFSALVAVGMSNVSSGARVYLSDNAIDNARQPVTLTQLVAGRDPVVGTPPVSLTGVTPLASSTVETFVLANSGARPADRDAVDARIVLEVQTRTGDVIASQNTVLGWPTLAANVRGLTTPANPHVVTASGYTNLETWLHDYATTVETVGVSGSTNTAEQAKVSTRGRVDLIGAGRPIKISDSVTAVMTGTPARTAGPETLKLSESVSARISPLLRLAGPDGVKLADVVSARMSMLATAGPETVRVSDAVLASLPTFPTTSAGPETLRLSESAAVTLSAGWSSPVAHLEQALGVNGGTTAAIDTTGATFILLFVAGYSSTMGSVVVSDSKGNPYTSRPLQSEPGDIGGQFFYVANPTVSAGVADHTFTVSGSFIYASIAVSAHSGQGLAPFDVENAGHGIGVSSVSTGVIHPSANNEIVFVGAAYGDTAAAIDSGFTQIGSDVSTVGAVNYGVTLFYKVQSTATDENPTVTVSSPSGLVANILALRPAGPVFVQVPVGSLALSGLYPALAGLDPAPPALTFTGYAPSVVIGGVTPTPTDGTVTCTFALELGGASGGGFDSVVFDSLLFDGGASIDLSNDVVRGQGIVCQYGIRGNTPNDRIADTGTLSFLLNNSQSNSAHLVGYYSPLNANVRSGFTFNAPVRWSLTSGETTVYKFVGKIDTIVPAAGVKRERVTQVQAVDWMDQAAELDLPDIPVQVDKRGDEIVSAILNALPSADQPSALDVQTSVNTYTLALDGAIAAGATFGGGAARPKVREVLNQLALSGYEYGYVIGDSATGGVFRWENRHHRVINQTPLAILDDSSEVALVVPGQRGDVYSTIQVFVNPVDVDTDANTILWDLKTAAPQVPAGATDTSLFGTFTDPNTNDSCGGKDVRQPAPLFDFIANSSPAGDGTDITSSFSCAAIYSGLGVSFTIANHGAVAGYVTRLRARGRAIRRSSAVVTVTVPNSYGTRVFQMSMPYQGDTNLAAATADHLADLLAAPTARVESVTFLANRSATLMGAALLREPGDRVAVSETITGLDGIFTINSVSLTYERANTLWCTWGLEPATSPPLWLWGVAGHSEWGVTTMWGF